MMGILFGEMQIISQPLPRIDLRRIQPGLPIRQWQKEPPPTNDNGQQPRRSAPQR